MILSISTESFDMMVKWNLLAHFSQSSGFSFVE